MYDQSDYLVGTAHSFTPGRALFDLDPWDPEPECDLDLPFGTWTIGRAIAAKLLPEWPALSPVIPWSPYPRLAIGSQIAAPLAELGCVLISAPEDAGDQWAKELHALAFAARMADPDGLRCFVETVETSDGITRVLLGVYRPGQELDPSRHAGATGVCRSLQHPFEPAEPGRPQCGAAAEVLISLGVIAP